MRLTSITAGVLAFILCGSAAQAQDQRADLQQLYLLWGMMDGSGNACWEIANYDPQYMEELEGWRQRNLAVRDEIDAIRVAAGLTESFVADVEEQGRSGLSDIMHKATNGPEACGKWLADTRSGQLDAETYFAESLGRLRERDGL